MWDRHVHTAVFKTDNQQGPTQATLLNVMAAWMGGEFGGEWMHVNVWLSPFAVLEIITTLSTGYTSTWRL